MKSQRIVAPVRLAIVVGAAVWILASVLSGKREAWDSTVYWVLGYPASLLTCAYLGYVYPKRSWLWALVLFEAQLVAMCARNGELGNLLPMGAVLFAVLAAPGMLVAKLAARRNPKSEVEVS